MTPTSFTVSWVDPVVGTPPFDKQVQFRIPSLTQVWTDNPAGTTQAQSQLCSNLTPGTTYDVRVHITNSGGQNFSQIISATTPQESFSPNNTEIFNNDGINILDANGHTWDVTGGQVVVDGVVDATTSSVVECAYIHPTGSAGAVWQFNGSLWWFKNVPSDTWSPPGGTATSPLPAPPPVAGAIPVIDVRIQNPRQTTVDSAGVTWGISPMGKVMANGAELASTSGVTRLSVINNVVYHENYTFAWFQTPVSATPASSGWSSIGNPLPQGLATRVKDFSNSIGVGTHINWGNYTPQQHITALQYLGVKLIRGAVNAGASTQQVFAGIPGLRGIFLQQWGSPATDLTFWARDIGGQIASTGLSSIFCFEGPNEPMGGQEGWSVAQLQQSATELGSAVAARADTRLNVPTITFSNWFVGSAQNDINYNNQVGDETGRGINMVDIHGYTAVSNMGTQPWYCETGPNAVFNGGTSLRKSLSDGACPGRSFIVTEGGYNFPGANTGQIFAQATIRSGPMMLQNYYFDVFDAGGAAFIAYSLFNESDPFQLFNTSVQPYPMADMIHNLMIILTDSASDATTFTPQALPYSLSANGTGQNLVRSRMFQKANGHFWLALWNEPEVNGGGPSDIFPAATNIQVTFGRAVSAAFRFDATQGNTSRQTIGAITQGAPMTVAIAGTVQLIELTSPPS